MKERMRPETELEQDAKKTKGERGRRACWTASALFTLRCSVLMCDIRAGLWEESYTHL